MNLKTFIINIKEIQEKNKMKIQNQTLQEFINKFIVKLENENYYKKE